MPPTQPAPVTLARYGYVPDEFWALWKAQGETCGFCHVDAHDKYVIDHEHVAGWKSMSPEERRKYVRGIIGVAENHWILTNYMNAERARLAYEYLTRYEARKAAA